MCVLLNFQLFITSLMQMTPFYMKLNIENDFIDMKRPSGPPTNSETCTVFVTSNFFGKCNLYVLVAIICVL